MIIRNLSVTTVVTLLCAAGAFAQDMQPLGALPAVVTAEETDLPGENTGSEAAFHSPATPAAPVQVSADEAEFGNGAWADPIYPRTKYDLFQEGKTGDGKVAYGCRRYRFRAFGEYLYLRPRSASVPYAVEADLNLPAPPVQRSRIAVVDPDYSSGFRAGFAHAWDDCSELVASYTRFESRTHDSITRNPDLPLHQIFPMTIHPATQFAGSGTVEAAADYGIDFQFVDLDFRRALIRTESSDVFGVVGVRYGKLEQDLFARYSDLLGGPNEIEVFSDIDFEGVGLKLGVEMEHYARHRPLLMYLKGGTSLLAGELDATYQQTVHNNAALGVDTSWGEGRIVPTFDLEIGGGWYSPTGRFQATAGYAYSVWTNVLKNEAWIHGVRNNRFSNSGEAISFDGLVVRVEGRF